MTSVETLDEVVTYNWLCRKFRHYQCLVGGVSYGPAPVPQPQPPLRDNSVIPPMWYP
jgi:hypothetical protein